jgi:hypothetical protein
MPGPAAALGLPTGVPDVLVDAPALRYALLALGLLWVAAALRARGTVVVVVAVAFATVASGFWVLGLDRPYGLFEDPGSTRRAAELSVAEAAPAAGSFLAGEPRSLPPLWTGLLDMGAPARLLIGLPSWLPVLTAPAVALVLGLAWRRRQLALLAACLWLAFHTGDIEALRGGGYLPSQWRQPEAALAWPVVVGLVLLASRLPTGKAGGVAVGLLVLAGFAALGVLAGPGDQPGFLDRIWLLTFDHGPWLWLALPALARASDPATLALASGGTVLTLLPGASAWVAPWAAAGLCRLGFLLASAETLAAIGGWMRRQVEHGLPSRLRGLPPDRWALALALVVMLPGSFGAWWDPLRSDPAYERSVEPLSPSYRAPMAWIRSNTPPDSVFVASDVYAPLVGVLGGRQVLRAPGLRLTPDDPRRSRVEGLLLRGRPLPDWARAYPVHFVFVAAGDFQDRALPGPEALEHRPGLKLRYADRSRYRVYEVARE